jgi:hypothetical protein
MIFERDVCPQETIEKLKKRHFVLKQQKQVLVCVYWYLWIKHLGIVEINFFEIRLQSTPPIR